MTLSRSLEPQADAFQAPDVGIAVDTLGDQPLRRQLGLDLRARRVEGGPEMRMHLDVEPQGSGGPADRVAGSAQHVELRAFGVDLDELRHDVAEAAERIDARRR